MEFRKFEDGDWNCFAGAEETQDRKAIISYGDGKEKESVIAVILAAQCAEVSYLDPDGDTVWVYAFGFQGTEFQKDFIYRAMKSFLEQVDHSALMDENFLVQNGFERVL